MSYIINSLRSVTAAGVTLTAIMFLGATSNAQTNEQIYKNDARYFSIQSVQRAGEYAAKFAKENQAGKINPADVESLAKDALAPLERQANGGESPYQVMYDLQDSMQALVGIVRNESEMMRAGEAIQKFKARSKNVVAPGNREYNGGWHTALDLKNLLTVSEAITRCAVERKESRGGHFREDYPNKDEAFGKFNLVIRKGSGGEMQLVREPLKEIREDLKKVIEEQKT